MIGLLFNAVGGMSLVMKLAMAGTVLAVLGIAYGVWHHKVWERGYAKAIADIAQQDERAINRASQARSVVLDCRSRGLRWDQSTGQCDGR
jgi:hypothetical protein